MTKDKHLEAARFYQFSAAIAYQRMDAWRKRGDGERTCFWQTQTEISAKRAMFHLLEAIDNSSRDHYKNSS